ncbi:MAG: 50S ribosomal protein L24 [Bacteroidota bacterium]
MRKFNIKKSDIVKVIAGDSKGQQGKVLVIMRSKNTALVEGINMVSKHSKPTAKTPQGGIIKQESPIHISNLMLIDAKGNATRVGRRLEKDKLVRYSKKSKEVIK